jgi:3-hydroxyisobutyrate dehydrogenase-like beta-hydroxyacid dehydrogenase
MTPVGLIGLGLLGSAMAERLAAAGYVVHGFDTNSERRDAFAAAGGVFCDSASSVFQNSSTVVLSLPNSKIVAEVLTECCDRIERHLIIDTTTGAPEDARLFSSQLESHGACYLDATVVGSSEQTRQGHVITLIGGTAEGFEQACPLLKCFSTQQCYTGPSGTGATAKLIVNLVIGLNRAVLAEALNLAKCCQMDQRSILEILRSGAAYSKVMDVKGEKMIAEDFTPQARLDQHWKDVALILELGRSTNAAVPLSELHSQLLERVSAMGFGQLDNSAIIKAFGGVSSGPC